MIIIRKTWVLSIIHWIFGTIFFSMGLIELLRLNAMNIPELTLYTWFKLFIGASFIILGCIFVKNIIKPTEGSFFNLTN